MSAGEPCAEAGAALARRGQVTALASFALEGGELRQWLSEEEIARALAEGRSLWVDLDSGDDEQWRLLEDVFHFHPLAIEDTRSAQGRVKVEEYGDFLFVVVRETQLEGATPDPYDLHFNNLCLFIGKTFTVSVHDADSAAVCTVVDRLEAGADPLGPAGDHLAYHLLDTVTDGYFPLLDGIDALVDELEERVLDGDRAVLDKVFRMRRMLAQLRRHLAPAREVMATLANRPSAYLRPETQIYFRDVYDHVVRQLESVETYRDLLSGAMETHLSVISNRMNEVIKAISVIGTVVLPPTLIASIYGMNFKSIPMAEHPLGFWFAIALMTVVSVVFVVYLWWKRWV